MQRSSLYSYNKKFKADTGSRPVRFNSLLCEHATGVLVLQEKILQQNFLEKCSEFTEQKNRLLKFIVVVSVLAFFLSIGITMYAVSQPDSILGLVTMNDFGETQYIGPVSRKTIKTLMFQNLTDLLVRIARTNWSYKHIVI